jgi:hypothetical protein
MCISRKHVAVTAIGLFSLVLVACDKKQPSSSTQPEAETPAQDIDPEPKNFTLVAVNQPVSFNGHIQPILSEYCYHCHGPDGGSRQPEKNPLRLDKEADVFAARENGQPVIIKGNPDKSYLIELIESDDKEKIMPPHPNKSPHGKIMEPEEIALIRRWIKEGAVFEDHWAYIQPKKQELPEVANKDWAKENPIDRFIAVEFEKSGLEPSPQEKPARLYRRLFFDLTGLPPTSEELEKLLTDKREFDIIYAEVVDQLLKTDAYAEHWSRHWLDVARYGDTHGIHNDNYRSIWPYRDWVINSFRANMPFDQFTREQVAGDMMPNATLDQIIATGFNRCLPTTGEGGAIADEYNAIYAQDRTDTTSAAWLGLTTGCAACHDHKFDAISTKENYQFTAFFRNTPMAALDRNSATHPPNIKVQRDEDKAKSDSLAEQITSAEKALTDHRKSAEAQFKTWHQEQQTNPAQNKALPGLAFAMPLNDPKKGITDTTGTTHKTEAPVKWVDGPTAKAAHLEDNAITIQNSPSFEADQSFSYGAWLNLPHRRNGGLIAKMGTANGFRGFDLWLNGNKLAAHLISTFPNDTIKVTTKGLFPRKTWFHAMVTYDGSRKAKGLKIYINGKSSPLQVDNDTLKGSIKNDLPLTVGRRQNSPHVLYMQITGLQIYNRTLTPAECATLGSGSLIKNLIALKSPDAKQLQKIRDHYFGTVDTNHKALSKNLTTLKQEKDTLDKKAPITLVMKENADKKPFAHVLIRGNYSNKAKEQLSPDTPASLPPMGDLPRNRLGLAQWLTKPENPLPARITVNRYWYYLFGRGIVETTGDFGVMGSRPTHPKLLDWLAVDFVENKWDLHSLLRTIVTSSTYQQSSVITAKHLKIDPQNILLSRGPRYRLDAEQIRDLALKASGLLEGKIGGPSVKPYQPKGIWSSVAMKGSNTRLYKADQGENLYRRSMYTFWKRTAPHPAMDILNAPVREISCVRRELTNTPLQAFVIMNDPQFVEASRRLAERVMQKAKTPEERINAIAMALLSRTMSNNEFKVIKLTFDRAMERFTASPEAAQKLITVGESKPTPSLPASELAAWSIVANQILNMDETLNK